MKLMTKEILKKFPPLYSTDGKPKGEVAVIVKYFDPTGRMTYYATEFDPKSRTLFGFMHSPLGEDYDELGYSSLDEFEKIKSPYGLGIERDLYFGEHTLEEVMEKVI